MHSGSDRRVRFPPAATLVFRYMHTEYRRQPGRGECGKLRLPLAPALAFRYICTKYTIAFYKKNMETGLTHTSELIVKEENTARSLGSGDLPVLATPALVALMENAAMLAVASALPEESTTVGGEICCRHNRPTAVGRKVRATARLETIENGRKLTFRIEAEDEQGSIGEATHVRFVVDRERFLSKL